MSRHTMAQTVHVGAFAHAALQEGTPEGPLQGAASDRPGVVLHAVTHSVSGDRGEQPTGRVMSEPERAQLFQGPLGQRHETIFVSFAPDAQEHPLRIDVGNPQEQTFTEAQAAGIDRGQTDPVHRRAHAQENLLDFLPAQDHGQFLFPARAQELKGGPVTLEGVLEQELEAAQSNGGGGAGGFLFQGEEQEVATQFFFGDLVRGFVVVFGQAADRTDITGLGFRGVTVQLHILDESSTQRRHVNPFWRGWLIIPGKGWIRECGSALSERIKLPEEQEMTQPRTKTPLSAKRIEFNHHLGSAISPKLPPRPIVKKRTILAASEKYFWR